MIEINSDILLAQIVTFVIAVFVLWKIAWKPILNMMKTRQERIRHDLEIARGERIVSEEIKKNLEKQLENIKLESQKIITQAMSEGYKEKEKIINTAKNEADRILSETQQELKREKDKVIFEIRSEIGEIAVGIVEHLLKTKIDKALHSDIIDKIITDIQRTKREIKQ